MKHRAVGSEAVNLGVMTYRCIGDNWRYGIAWSFTEEIRNR